MRFERFICAQMVYRLQTYQVSLPAPCQGSFLYVAGVAIVASVAEITGVAIQISYFDGFFPVYGKIWRFSQNCIGIPHHKRGKWRQRPCSIKSSMNRNQKKRSSDWESGLLEVIFYFLFFIMKVCSFDVYWGYTGNSSPAGQCIIKSGGQLCLWSLCYISICSLHCLSLCLLLRL